MVVTRAEESYEKYAWTLLSLLGVIGIIFGLGLMFVSPDTLTSMTGLSWDTSHANVATEWIRTIGQWILFSSLIITIVSVDPYRKGERWSWYVMVVVLVNLLVGAARDLVLGFTGFYPIWFPLVILPIVLALFGLLLPYRKFFPVKTAMTPRP